MHDAGRDARRAAPRGRQASETCTSASSAAALGVLVCFAEAAGRGARGEGARRCSCAAGLACECAPGCLGFGPDLRGWSSVARERLV